MQKRKLAEFVESYFEEATECEFCGEPAKYKCCGFSFCDECRREMIEELKNPRLKRKPSPPEIPGYRTVYIASPPSCQMCHTVEADFGLSAGYSFLDICKECAQELLECLKYAKDVSAQIRRTAKSQIDWQIAEAKRCPTAELYIKELKSRLSRLLGEDESRILAEYDAHLDEEGAIEFWAAVQESD